MEPTTNAPLPHLHKDWSRAIMKLNEALWVCLDVPLALPSTATSGAEAKRMKPSGDRPKTIKQVLKTLFSTLQCAHALINDKPLPEGKDEGLGVFAGLHSYFVSKLDKDEEAVKEFCAKTLPCIIKQALGFTVDTPTVPAALREPKFSKGVSCGIERFEHAIPRQHVAYIIASMFLCIIPRRRRDRTKYYNERDYSTFFRYLKDSSQEAKLKMVLEYFNAISDRGAPLGNMRFRLLYGSDLPKSVEDWKKFGTKMCPLEVFDKGAIEDKPSEVIQTDFANRFIGGGVLESGRVQEEIRFCTAPELQASILFLEAMHPMDAIQLLGFETYSAYTGYANSLKFAKAGLDPVKRAADGTPQSYLTAIDAVSYNVGDSRMQYIPGQLLRELNKAFVGFCQFPREDWLESSAEPNAGQQVSEGDCKSSTANDDRKSQHQDLQVIHNYAESLTERLMVDIRSSLRLVIPDYFGFNVIHYDPLKERDMEHLDVKSSDMLAQPGDIGLDSVSNSNSNSRSLREYVDRISGDIVADALSSVCRRADEAEMTKKSQERNQQAPNVEVEVTTACTHTTNTDSGISPVTVDMELEVSFSENANTTTPNSGIDIEMNASADYNTDFDMSATASRIGANIDVQIVVSSVPNSEPEAHNVNINIASGSVEDETSINHPLSQLSLSDSLKQRINHYAQAVSDEVLSAAYAELEERQRLFIENNISSTDFAAAQKLSANVMGQIFGELQNEAENSISDTEKLLKAPDNTQLEAFADSLVSSVISRAKSDRLPLRSTSRKPALSPRTVSPYQESRRAQHLGRRSSAPVTTRSNRLEHIPRWGSEPSMLFRSKSAQCDSGRKLSDYIHQEFCRPQQGSSMRRSSFSASSNASSGDPFWTEFVRRPNPDSLSAAHQKSGSKDMQPPRSPRKSGDGRFPVLSHALPTLSDEDQISLLGALTPKLDDTERDNSRPLNLLVPQYHRSTLAEGQQVDYIDGFDGKERELSESVLSSSQFESRSGHGLGPLSCGVIPTLVTIDEAHTPSVITGASSSSSSYSNSSPDILATSADRGHGLTPPVSPIQHQYLKLFSEVLAEDILHESLGKVEKRIIQSDKKRLAEVGQSGDGKLSGVSQSIERFRDRRLAEVTEEEEGELNEAMSADELPNRRSDCNGFRPIATGNWGCGVFGGDAQLKSLLQWVAASQAKCPKMLYYTFCDERVAKDKLAEIGRLLGGGTVGDVMDIILDYCEARDKADPKKRPQAFDFIKSITQ